MTRHLLHQEATLRSCTLILLFSGCVSVPAVAREAVVAQTSLTFSMAEDWFHEIKESTSPEGRSVQHWGHKPVSLQGERYMPEITAWTEPLEEDSNLVELTKETLRAFPFETTLGVAECLKCVSAILPRPGAFWLPRTGPTKSFAPAISFEDWSDCELGKVTDYHGTCIFQRINHVDLSIEPSWVFRFQKDVDANTMDVIMINLILEQKLVVIAFWFPLAMSQQLTDEIFSIIKSIRSRDESTG